MDFNGRCSRRWSTPAAQGYYSHLMLHKDSRWLQADDVLKNAKNLALRQW
jgi:hypothetical protein